MKNFEQHVHNRFDGREVKVDKNELWANISPQLDSTQKDRRKAWWFFLMGLSVGVVLLSLFLFSQDETAIDQAVNITPTITNTAVSLEKEIVQANTLTNQQLNNSTAKKEKQKNIENNTTTTINKNYSNNKNTLSNSNISARAKDIKPVGNQFPETSIIKINNSKPTSQISPLKTAATLFQNSFEPEQQIEKKVNNFAKAKTEKQLNEQLLELPSLTTELFSNTVINEENIPTDITEYDDSFITPQKSKLRFGLGIYAGVSKTQNTLQENDQSEYIYTQLRASTEDQLQTVHLGFSALIEIKRNLYLQTGFEYSKISSRLNLDDEWILMDTVDNLLIRNGVVNDTIGAGDQFIFSQVIKNTTRNSFHLLDLPVLVGYQFGKARWRVGLEAGVFINLRLRKEGQIMSPTISMYDLNTDNNDWYETNVGIRPHFGIISTYDLNNNYQLYFSTGMTFNQVFSTGNNPIKEQKSMFGIRLGGRYYF